MTNLIFGTLLLVFMLAWCVFISLDVWRECVFQSAAAEREELLDATSSRRFTVEGDPSDVFAFAERFGLKVTRPRWWQRTYAVPRWIVWLVVAWWILGLPRAIETLVGWFS